MSSDEQKLIRALERTYPVLDGWAARCATTAERPQRGSELFADDQAWTHHPISEAVRMSLALSVEHLRMTRTVLDTRELYPSAYFTLLRGALVGAAQAVYVLAPDEPAVRQARGWTVLAEMYSQLGIYYGDASDLKPGSVPLDQRAWLEDRRAALKALRGTDKRLHQTKMITAALEATFPKNPGLCVAGRLLWREMSSDAHVLGWGVFTRAALGRAERGSGLAPGVVGGSVEKIAEPYMCAFRLARAGWSLFDRRCEGP